MGGICLEHVFHILQSVVASIPGLIEDEASELLDRGTLTLLRIVSGFIIYVFVITLEESDDLLESFLLADPLSCWQGLNVPQ